METERLAGDRPVPSDGDALAPVLADERVAARLWPGGLGGQRTLEQSRDLVRSDIAHWDRHGFGPWVVRLGEAVVGRVGLASTTIAGASAVEVAWLLSPDHWGRGYAREMAAAAVRAAFDDLDLDEIVSFTLHDNLPSQAVMRALGFTYAHDIEHAGMPHVLYRLTRGATRPAPRGAPRR